MHVAFAMARVRFTPVGARAFLPAIAIATAPSSMPSAYAEERVQQTSTRTASAIALTRVSGRSMPAVFATDPVQFMPADVLQFLRATAIATATNSTLLGCAEGPALLTPMAMAFAIQTRFSDAQTQMPATSMQLRIRTTVLASMWMHSACAEALAQRTQTTTTSATTKMPA